MSDRQTMFAVVQTGAITPSADIVPFKGDDGQRTPAILFVHADRDKCVTRRNRIIRESARIRGIVAGGVSEYMVCTPVLGIVQLEVDLPKKRVRPVAPPQTNGTPPANSQPELPKSHSRRGKPLASEQVPASPTA